MDLGELEQRREQLRPAEELVGNPHFVSWAKGLRSELEALKELPWALGPKSATAHLKILESCGLKFPKDSRELLECFVAVKAVVHYVEKRLRELEAQAKKFQELTRKMQRVIEEEKLDA